jgi:hypothetical protein
MIMIWNRKEVFVGASMQKFNEVRYKLSDNNIPLPSSKVSEVDAAGFQGSFLKKVCKKNKLF